MGKQDSIKALRDTIAELEPKVLKLKQEISLKQATRGSSDPYNFKNKEQVIIHNLGEFISELEETLDYYKGLIKAELKDDNV